MIGICTKYNFLIRSTINTPAKKTVEKDTLITSTCYKVKDYVRMIYVHFAQKKKDLCTHAINGL